MAYRKFTTAAEAVTFYRDAGWALAPDSSRTLYDPATYAAGDPMRLSIVEVDDAGFAYPATGWQEGLGALARQVHAAVRARGGG